jgi:hypothetical protein
MNIADFEDLLDRLGEDISSWPGPQQQAATDFLQSSADARTALAQARLLRCALSAPPVRAEAGLTERIMQALRPGDAAAPAESVPVVQQPETTVSVTSPPQTSSDGNCHRAPEGALRSPPDVAGGNER